MSARDQWEALPRERRIEALLEVDAAESACRERAAAWEYKGDKARAAVATRKADALRLLIDAAKDGGP